MSEAKKLITRWSRDFQGNLQEDPNGSWVLAADAAIRDKRLMDKIDQMQQRLTAADDRADVLEGLLREVQKSARKQDWASGYPTLFSSVDAALKPAEGGGDSVDYHDLCASKGCDAGKSGGSLFCAAHQSAKSRTRVQSQITAEGLEWMMQNDGYQQ